MKSLITHALHASSSSVADSQAYHTNRLNYVNNQVHQLISHQKGQCSDQSMKLAFDVDQFVGTV